jgi:hypothetical protein
MIQRLIFYFVFLTFGGVLWGQTPFGPPSLQKKIAEHNLSETCHSALNPGLIGTGRDEFSKVDPPEWFTPGSDRVANIVVSYSQGFPLEAQTALEYALDIWGQLLNSEITIWVNAEWGTLSSGVLAQAGPETLHSNFPGATYGNKYFPGSLANSLSVSDLSPGQPDLNITFGDDINWYYGMDGNTPGSKYDFVTVALHEVSHGLGFIGSATHNGNSGFTGVSGTPLIYDVFVETSDGTSILSFNSGTIDLGEALESDGLFWNGAEGWASSTIGRPRLYAPANWNGGSSFSHLRENTYQSGTENSLMTPFLGTAEAIHSPGPVVEGMFRDMGWSMDLISENCGILSAVSGLQLPCNPASSTYTQQVVITYENNPTLGVIVVNGTSHSIGSSPQTVTLVNQPADGLPVDVEVYFTSQPDCMMTFPAAYTAIDPCCLNLRITEVNPFTKTVSINNIGNCDDGLDGFSLFSDFTVVDLVSLVTPGYVIVAGGTLEVVWSDWDPTFIYTSEGEMSLVNPINQVVDYVQWGSPNHAAELNAVTNNIWENNDYIAGEPPFIYTGTGEFGVAEWSFVPYVCNVIGASAGVTSDCDLNSGVYTQEINLTLLDPPSSGEITLNGQDFVLDGNNTSSLSGEAILATLTLEGLVSNGLTVDLNITFGDDVACGAVFSEVFSAPIACYCLNDANVDGSINVGDILLVLAEFGCTAGCTADVTSDGNVNVSDLLSILSEFGQPCNL